MNYEKNYEKKYKEALERARKELQEFKNKDCDDTTRRTAINIIRNLFTELKESESERIRKELIEFLKLPHSQFVGNREHEKWIAWLEKQSEVAKTSDQKVEPKFKVGDWITDGYLHCKITEILDDRYIIEYKFSERSAILFEDENHYHLWSIQDAKDGDVLLEEETGEPFVYNGNRAKSFSGYFLGAHCGIYNGKFNPYGNNHYWGKNSCPATKEQRDLLFQKMKEAAYEWDAEKKKLKKIEVASKESENERIKQEILELVSIAGNGSQFEEIKDWLEKQEQVFEQGNADDAKSPDKHPHWISVKDRKPKLKHSIDNQKYSDTVIVTDGKYRTSARWVHNTWAGWYGWYDAGDEELKGVTQWMPMPEPPKEGGEK